MTDVKLSKAARRASTRGHPHLAFLLGRARRLIDDEVTRRINAAGFTDLRTGHSAVFAFLPLEGARLTELASRARMTKQAMGEVVRELEGLGYVERAEDPDDRRAKVIRFTEAGRRADEVGILAVRDVEREWAAQIGADRIRALRSTLTTVVAAVDKRDRAATTG